MRELPDVLRASDLFLLTTEPPESFGIVLIEAMASGLPVIASDYPGVRAVVDDGTGRLVERGNPNAVAAALRELVAAGARRPRGDRRRRPGEGGARVELAAAGRAHGRGLRGGDRDASGKARSWRMSEPPSSRRILLVAYFYPPSRDTGVLRPAAMAKWLRRLGHEVTVLTTSAYGSEPGEERVVRTADAQRWRARMHGADHIDALFDSDTYANRPHPLSRVLVPEALVAAWAPFARSRALRLNRERRFDCVITTSPPESAHLVGAALRRGAACPGSRTYATRGRSSRCDPSSRPRPSAASTSASSAAGSAPPTRSSASPSRRRTTCAGAGSPTRS